MKKDDFTNKVVIEMYPEGERYFRNRFVNPDMIDDLIQEVFAEVHKNASMLLRHENYKGWVIDVAHYKLLNARKRNKYLREKTVYIEDVNEEKLGYVQEFYGDNILDELYEKLSEDDVNLMNMHYCIGYSSPEMAKLLHISEPAFRMRLSRAVNKARKALGVKKDTKLSKKAKDKQEDKEDVSSTPQNTIGNDTEL